MMSDLKPCPFCGEAAETWVDPSHSKAVFFGCRVEDCCGEMHWLPTEAEAIAAWNRRAADPQPVAHDYTPSMDPNDQGECAVCGGGPHTRISPAPVAGVAVKPLEWHNFDAWTYWAEAVCGTYHVEERNGGWIVELRVGGLVHRVTETDDTRPSDLEAAQAAAQADYETRIRSALIPAAHAPQDTVALVERLVDALRSSAGPDEKAAALAAARAWKEGK